MIPDSREIKGHLWLNPREALEKEKIGEIHLMAPTVKNLELLSKFDSTAAALGTLKTRRFDTIMPKIRFGEKGNRIVLYPWDPEYRQ